MGVRHPLVIVSIRFAFLLQAIDVFRSINQLHVHRRPLAGSNFDLWFRFFPPQAEKIREGLYFLFLFLRLTSDEIAISVADDIVGLGAKFLQRLTNDTQGSRIVDRIFHDRNQRASLMPLEEYSSDGHFVRVHPIAEQELPSVMPSASSLIVRTPPHYEERGVKVESAC